MTTLRLRYSNGIKVDWNRCDSISDAVISQDSRDLKPYTCCSRGMAYTENNGLLQKSTTECPVHHASIRWTLWRFFFESRAPHHVHAESTWEWAIKGSCWPPTEWQICPIYQLLLYVVAYAYVWKRNAGDIRPLITPMSVVEAVLQTLR